MSVFSVHLCQGWQRIGSLSGDAFAFEGVERELSPGEWQVSFPEGSPSWSSYVNDDGDTVPYGPRDVDTVRLMEDGAVRFAGFVGEISAGSGAATRSYTPAGVRWSIGGPDLWGLLATRLAYPDPSLASGWASSHDTRNLVASTALAEFLEFNIGASALTDRQVPGFGIVDAAVGSPGPWSARLQTLTEVAQRICADGGVTMRLTVDLAGQVVASIAAPRDLSAVHILSDQGDLTSVVSRYVPARSTFVLAGGTGTGTGRVFRSADDGQTGAARLERFSDQTSLSQTSELQASADATLIADGGSWAITGEISDEATLRVGFGRTVHVGDRVSVQSQGRRFPVPVTSVAWSITPERQVCRPKLGDAVPDAFNGLLLDVAGLSARFDRTVA